jgi:hypothetical protein
MTTSAQLNQARLSVQQTINQTKTVVTTLETKVSSGSTWNEINTEWNKTSSTLTTTSSTLTNLSRQNDGLNNDIGQIRLTQQLTRNSLEVTEMQGKMTVVQKSSYSNLEISDVRKNISKDSAGVIAQNASIGSEEKARTFSPVSPSGNSQILKWGVQEDDGLDVYNEDYTKPKPIPIGTRFPGTKDLAEVVPVLDSQNKPTNARKAELSGIDEAGLGDAKGSGTTSTAGGNRVVIDTDNVNSRANATNTGQITDDDSVQTTKNSVGNASQSVEGRAVIADEFLKKIIPTPNKLSGLASQTYTISIYLMDSDEFKKFLSTDKKILPSQQLIMQSGGAPFGQRNKYFDVDFYPENLELKCQIGTQGSASPHNVLTMKFDIIEPQGITFLERLRQAVWAHTGRNDMTFASQNYLMVIRFYGYDDQGNLVSNAAVNNGNLGEVTSDPNALVEKFIPFQIADVRYKIKTSVVEYNINCIPITQIVGYSTSRGTIPFNFQLSAVSVQSLFNGNTQMEALQKTKVENDDEDGGDYSGFDGTVAKAPPPAAKKIGHEGRTITQGLTTALNEHQAELVKCKGYLFADKYIIELEDVPGLIDARIKKPTTVLKRTTPLNANSSPNQRLNQKRQFVDTEAKEYSISAGTQITQLIDQVMKNSSYITAQQTIVFDEVTKKSELQTPVQLVMWYRITQIATPLQYDTNRNDYAYEIKYRITRYQINTPRSPYFPDAMYRGPHKLYDYWFTGLNTEVINFEIDANSNYVSPINNSALTKTQNIINPRYAEKRFFQPSAEESTQGGEGESTLPAAALASRLYSYADVVKCSIEIVGDPDWITQSELFYKKTSLGSFEADGSVNSTASEALFEIRFNKVSDYDMATGLTPVYKNNMDSQITGDENLAEEALVFCVLEITNYFKDGRFTQKIEGALRDFDTAVDSPKKKEENKNQDEDKTIQTPKGKNTKLGMDGCVAGPTVVDQKAGTIVPGKTTKFRPTASVPIGSRGNGQFLDTRGTPKPGSNTVSDDAGSISMNDIEWDTGA